MPPFRNELFEAAAPAVGSVGNPKGFISSCPVDPLEALGTVERELASYGADLEKKPVAIVASKVDLPGSEPAVEVLRDEARRRGLPFVAISALTGEGVPELLKVMSAMVFPDSKDRSTITAP
jgi:GTP-binding protein